MFDFYSEELVFEERARTKSLQAIVKPLEPRPSRWFILATIVGIWLGLEYNINSIYFLKKASIKHMTSLT